MPDQTIRKGMILTLAWILGLIGLTAASPSAGQEQETRKIFGMSRERAQQLPGVQRLFEIRNASAPPRILDEKFRLGEVVARFRLEVSDEDVLWLAKRAGADRVVRKSPLGLFLIKGPPSQVATETMMSSLWETGEVVMISPNYVTGGLSFVPNDPLHVSGAQWYLETLGIRDLWDGTRGSSEIVVAVMDTGIRVNHPEFAGRLWTNPGEIPGNGLDDDGNLYVDDVHGWNTTVIENPGDQGNGDIEDNVVGHGTYVTSILLANADNAHQVAGIDHSAKILTVRAIAQPTGTVFDQVLAGFDYLMIMSPHYKILNMSWEAGRLPPYAQDLDALAEAGVLMFAGAGNSGRPGFADEIYPASHPEVIAVQAVDDTDSFPSFANTGDSIGFSAPGVGVVTASWEQPFVPSAFHVGDGTSFACPMVAGTVSLGLALRPQTTKREFIFALKKAAVDLGPPGCDDMFGCGRIHSNDTRLVLESLIFFDDLETGDLTQWTTSSP